MADTPAARLMQSLEREYCPPLDPALFAAIVNDYDLEAESSVQQLRDTLDVLKLSAVEQEDLPFDPSGTSGREVADEDAEPDYSVSHPTLESAGSNFTSLESNISSLSLNHDVISTNGQREDVGASYSSSNDPERYSAISGLAPENKIAYLAEMFPSIDQFTIAYTLRKYADDVHRSMDVLLNFTYFDEDDAEDLEGKIHIPKGIDGFANGETPSKSRSKKRKGRQNRNRTFDRSESSSLSPHTTSEDRAAAVDNKWEKGKQDVEFISSRTYLSAQAVSSIYHLNGASLPATVHFLASREVDKESEKKLLEDLVTVTQVAELRESFSYISAEHLAGLLRLARNSISAAHELAGVMGNMHVRSPSIDWSSSKPKPKDPIDSQWQDSPAKRIARSATHSQQYSSAQAYANHHLFAGHDAFAKANSAYRRGKSDHLMGAAAGYYSAVGREHMEKAKREIAAAADARVDGQSTDTSLDLHGVSVQDAVRIASSRVADWWESLGDAKYVPGGRNPAREGYRIVTGLGRHSRNGTAKLGPAVARTLARQGWRVEVGQGALVVTGMVRQR